MTGIPEIGRRLKETLTEVTAEVTAEVTTEVTTEVITEASGKVDAGTEGAVPFKGGKKA